MNHCVFLAATKQLYEWYCPSVRPSVCQSHPFDNVPAIVSWNFREPLPLTKMMSMQKVRGQKSRSQRSKQILPQFGRFWAGTPTLIHRWLQNDAQSLKWHLKKSCLIVFQGNLSNFNVTRDKKKCQFWPELSVYGLWLVWIHRRLPN